MKDGTLKLPRLINFCRVNEALLYLYRPLPTVNQRQQPWQPIVLQLCYHSNVMRRVANGIKYGRRTLNVKVQVCATRYASLEAVVVTVIVKHL